MAEVIGAAGIAAFATAWVGGQLLIGARHSGEAELAELVHDPVAMIRWRPGDGL